ncbi:MAG: hypothetical protein AB4057_14890 [Crocosphaera sp.]
MPWKRQSIREAIAPLEDKQGITYPLLVMEFMKVLSWSEYNGD